MHGETFGHGGAVSNFKSLMVGCDFKTPILKTPTTRKRRQQ
jgi:hypothetical protein